MKRHKFNIFPEAKPEDYQRLREDIRLHGYDRSQPVTMFNGEVLDGWNRLKACNELSVSPSFIQFTGTDDDAIAFVMRTNKRRNLNSGQWATIAAEADELMAAIAEAVERERREKISDNNGQKQKPKETMVQFFEPSSPKDNSKLKDSKTAELFNTNRTYVNNAVKMKTAAPEVFKKVKAGTMTMQDGMKAVRAIPTDPWSESERERQGLVKKGIAVVANASTDKNLIAWAEAERKAIRIDRGSKYGNPFVMKDDGTRDEVCDHYRLHYLAYKPSILGTITYLKGKVLICHCFPMRCHGDSLADLANESIRGVK